MGDIIIWILGIGIGAGATVLFLKLTKNMEWFKTGMGKIVKILLAVLVFIIGYMIGAAIGRAATEKMDGGAAKTTKKSTDSFFQLKKTA